MTESGAWAASLTNRDLSGAPLGVCDERKAIHVEVLLGRRAGYVSAGLAISNGWLEPRL